MKNLLRSIVLSLIAVFLIISATQNVFAAGPQGPSATVLPKEDSGAEDNKIFINNFLYSLYNGLVDRGVLSDSRLLSPDDIWSRDFNLFSAAINHLNGGGFVTNRHFYLVDESPFVYYGGSDEHDLFLSFRNPDQSMPLGRRYGLPVDSCSVQNVDLSSNRLALKIGGNVQCIYRRYLRANYRDLPEPRPAFDYDYIINQSGVREELSSYLDGLRSTGLLLNYSINLENDSFELEVPHNARGDKKMKIMLSPEMVNIYSAQEEALLSEQRLSELSQEAFLYVHEQSLPSISDFSIVLLQSALGEVLKLRMDAEPQEKERVFLEMYGIVDSQMSNAVLSDPCTFQTDIDRIYPAPDDQSDQYFVYTPHNPCVTYYRGFDNFNNRAALFTSQMLMRLVDPIKSAFPEYKVTKLASRGGQKIPGSKVLDSKNFANAFKIAQSIFIDAHGRPDGSQALMCLNLDYAGVGCCETIKSLANEFGIDTSTMNCRRYPVDTKDPAGIFESISSGDGIGCEGPATIYDERCIIQMHSGIWNYAGAKAVTVSSQCYGGACNGVIPGGLNDHVRDYVAGLLNAENGAGISHDYKFLGRDVTGKTLQHLVCIPAGQSSDSPFCNTPPYGYDTIFDFGFRNVQQSTEVRGTNGAIGGMNHDTCIATPNPVNGAEQHCFLNMGGHPKVGIEFAPTVLAAGFVPDSPLFYMSFSSLNVEPNVGRVIVDDSSCKPRLSTDVHPERYLIDSEHAEINLSGYPVMDDDLWGNPTELQRRYGEQRQSWPWKLRVTLSGVKAHNGVSLDGNSAASQKWLWPIEPSVVPPWSNMTGVSPNGDNLVIDIPCAPPIQCCIPHLETQRTGPYSCQWVQNGCNCTEVGSVEDCYSIPPYYICSNPEQRFEGTPHIGASCCDAAPPTGVCNPVTDEVEVCPMLPCYNQTQPPPVIHNFTYHFRDWSMDRNGDQDCREIMGHCPTCDEI